MVRRPASSLARQHHRQAAGGFAGGCGGTTAGPARSGTRRRRGCATSHLAGGRGSSRGAGHRTSSTVGPSRPQARQLPVADHQGQVAAGQHGPQGTGRTAGGAAPHRRPADPVGRRGSAPSPAPSGRSGSPRSAPGDGGLQVTVAQRWSDTSSRASARGRAAGGGIGIRTGAGTSWAGGMHRDALSVPRGERRGHGGKQRGTARPGRGDRTGPGGEVTAGQQPLVERGGLRRPAARRPARAAGRSARRSAAPRGPSRRAGPSRSSAPVRGLVQRLVRHRRRNAAAAAWYRPAAACRRPAASRADSNARRSSSRRGWAHSPAVRPSRKSPP